jgi:Tfp pilus assembly protein PilO
MKRFRGKGVYVITAVAAVVILLAWYFLLFSPTRSEIATKTDEVQAAEANLNASQQQVARLESYKKTAPQSRSEIVQLGKMLPQSEGIPSLIVELTKTASSAGVDLTSIARGTSSLGQPFGIQTVNLQLSGHFFEVEDFLYKLESYVSFSNTDFRVTGRLLQVASVTLSGGAGTATEGTTTVTPLTVTVVLNAYLWGGSASASAGAGGGS